MQSQNEPTTRYNMKECAWLKSTLKNEKIDGAICPYSTSNLIAYLMEGHIPTVTESNYSRIEENIQRIGNSKNCAIILIKSNDYEKVISLSPQQFTQYMKENNIYCQLMRRERTLIITGIGGGKKCFVLIDKYCKSTKDYPK